MLLTLPVPSVHTNGSALLEAVQEVSAPPSPGAIVPEDERSRALKHSLSKLEDGQKTETGVRVDDLLR